MEKFIGKRYYVLGDDSIHDHFITKITGASGAGAGPGFPGFRSAPFFALRAKNKPLQSLALRRAPPFRAMRPHEPDESASGNL
jgi:hypothetical protein